MTRALPPVARDRKRRPEARRHSVAMRKARADKARGRLLWEARKP